MEYILIFPIDKIVLLTFDVLYNKKEKKNNFKIFKKIQKKN